MKKLLLLFLLAFSSSIVSTEVDLEQEKEQSLPQEQSFWDKNKVFIIASGIGVILGVSLMVYGLKRRARVLPYMPLPLEFENGH